jgi:folylpolyglutamate synthase
MSYFAPRFLQGKARAKVRSLALLSCLLLTLQDFVNLSTDAAALAGLTMQMSFAKKWKELDSSSDTEVKVLPSIEDAFTYVRKLSSAAGGKNESRQVHAFITGSVHLVGRALGALEGVDAL